ncbi:hypothetical protein Zm00014a_036813 [Zea mays]|uniref:Uncharacterized protein n=1 Tax=Zea mays TaxID=4577 RepID=A0A3L6FB15_MAIZE|nr:hypothetical protein Zm00014a_036813 [Zea mays]
MTHLWLVWKFQFSQGFKEI